MDLGGLRADVLTSNFALHGVPCEIILPGFETDPPIETRVIRSQETPMNPAGGDLRRAEARRLFSLRRADTPAVPRGTIVRITGDGSEWQVDATDRVEDDHVRVVVVPYEP